ncbi:hypothetical protein E4U43_001333 [Claviceps pusilla]|uniref:AA1-like domain-containing protein n=1 Tax=Claviceps pusilla TaxID=123648 RepID=A0A9P7N889_9HYPO|nr:hypothetical protein E4U43_001333 [Claviceps pusilla]
MHFSTSALLAAALLAGQTLAICQPGSKTGKPPASWHILGSCKLLQNDRSFKPPNGQYICGNNVAEVRFVTNRLSLIAATADTTVRVQCASQSHFYYCDAGSNDHFPMPCPAGSNNGITVEMISVA